MVRLGNTQDDDIVDKERTRWFSLYLFLMHKINIERSESYGFIPF